MTERPLASPVFKLKQDSKLMQLHQTVIKNKKVVNDKIFAPVYKLLEKSGVAHDEAVNFSFYSDDNFGFMQRSVPASLDADLKVLKHGFRGFKKTSKLFKDISQIFHDNFSAYQKLVNADHMLTVDYREFYTGRRQSGSMFSFVVLMPQVVNHNYYIGGPIVNLNSKLFNDNYESIDYADYLKEFSAAVKRGALNA